MKKKVVAAMLAACMAVSLTACGSSRTVPRRLIQTSQNRSRLLTILIRTRRIPRTSDSKEGRDQELFR